MGTKGSAAALPNPPSDASHGRDSHAHPATRGQVTAPVVLPTAMGRDAADNLQAYARLAGILGLVTLAAGGFGEAYVPASILSSGDAAATARNVLASEQLFRLGFAAYLVEALCDAGLTMAFWVLVRPVHRNLAMLMVVFRIISTCGFGVGQLLWYGSLITLRTAPTLTAIPPEQLHDMAYLLMRIGGFGGAMFSLFYGAANVVLGTLLYRSRIVPRVLGAGIWIAGVAFCLQTFLRVLAPAFPAERVMAAGALLILPLIFWLLIKGVDTDRALALQ